jgi:hypothetical protein
MDFKEGHRGAATDAGEGLRDHAGWNVAEGEIREASPQAAPPEREDAGPRGGAGAPQAHEDLGDHVVREGADAVISVWITMSMRRRREPEAPSRLQFHRKGKCRKPCRRVPYISIFFFLIFHRGGINPHLNIYI